MHRLSSWLYFDFHCRSAVFVCHLDTFAHSCTSVPNMGDCATYRRRWKLLSIIENLTTCKLGNQWCWDLPRQICFSLSLSHILNVDTGFVVLGLFLFYEELHFLYWGIKYKTTFTKLHRRQIPLVTVYFARNTILFLCHNYVRILCIPRNQWNDSVSS